MFEHLDSKTFAITGATGFVGRRILEVGLELRRVYDLKFRLVPVVRTVPTWLVGLVRNGEVETPIVSSFGQPLNTPLKIDVVFHCATPASATLNSTYPRDIFDLSLSAMDWVIKSDLVKKNEPLVLFTSSGAVYGELPLSEDSFGEDAPFACSPLRSSSGYAEGKRAAEFMLCEAGARGLLNPIVARLFTFAGTGLPIDRHYAVGNFVGDALRGEPIRVLSDGKAVRSYLNSNDMAQWLWVAATLPRCDFALHIGSELPISIGDLARLVASRYQLRTGNSVPVHFSELPQVPTRTNRYIPSTRKTREILGVTECTSLEESIDQMLINSQSQPR